MAKIVIEIDTDIAGIKTSIDGTDIANVAYVSASQYNGDDKPYVSIEIPSKLDNGLRSYLRYSTGSENETKLEFNKPNTLSTAIAEYFK